jgi:hypothetical protein
VSSLGALLLAILLAGCNAPSDPDAATVLAEEARYRILSSHVSPGSPDSSGEVRVRVAATGGWHIAPEAPLRLDFSSADVILAPLELRSEDAESLSDEGFAFATGLRAAEAGAATAQAKIKFGICEGPKEKCVIIRRDMEIPLEIVFTD